MINSYITDRWLYYTNKVEFPYKRQVGVNGEWVFFEKSEQYLYFLRNSAQADFLWTDFEELHVISNLYLIHIKVITKNGPEDPLLTQFYLILI